MSRSFRKIRVDNGTGSDPFLLLQRYRTKLTHDLDVQIAMANTDASQRNKLFKRHGSLVKFRERSERKIEQKLAQRAMTLGVKYRKGGKLRNWATFDKRYEERREQNDVIIDDFLSKHRGYISTGDDAGIAIKNHLKTYPNIDLQEFNSVNGWAEYVHDGK